jgi:hypothetical protein
VRDLQTTNIGAALKKVVETKVIKNETSFFSFFNFVRGLFYCDFLYYKYLIITTQEGRRAGGFTMK